MRKSPIVLLTLLFVFWNLKLLAQQNIVVKGNVKNAQTKENLSAVSVAIKGNTAGTYTDEKGDFRLLTNMKPPFTIIISSIGYSTKEINVESESQEVATVLEPSYALGQEIVVAASRVPERILESPVTIERINANAIRNAPGPNSYDALSNLKGVDVINSSYTFKTISTRGFNGSGNLRLNQLVDGMDNQAPALNFAVGNVIGLTDLDIDNMELLSGASSALYGSGGMNGTLLINSKDPFKYQGLSVQVKEGVMHVDDYRHKASPFHDFAFRWGKKVSDKFSFKIGAEYIQAQDWQADDSTDLLRNNVLSNIKTGPNTTRSTDPNYDGVNVYGDEASASLQGLALFSIFDKTSNPSLPYVEGFYHIDPSTPFYSLSATQRTEILTFYSQQPSNSPLAPLSLLSSNILAKKYQNSDGSPLTVSRTGYNEKNLVDYNSYDFKVSGGLYYNITSKLEASLTGNWGLGTSVYTGADRYSLKNFSIGQYKLEFKSPTWFLRAYTTQENSGDSYATTLTALSINNTWKTNGDWFTDYFKTYTGAVGLYNIPSPQANAAARAVADSGRYLPGSTQYNNAFNKAVTTPISNGGSQFADKSNLYHIEGQYNFSQYVKVVDVLLGASYRIYHLNSNNTIFYEPNGPINISEYGSYLQLQKQFFNDVLKLTASGRYDKNENFKGRFTPRATATIKVAKDNNFRLSYQQAYRFPNNQDQYINLFTPGSILIGSLPVFNTLYQFDKYPIYTATSVDNFRLTGDPKLLQKAIFVKTKPESMQSYEIGYRGIVSTKLLIDVYYYWSKYKNLIGHEAVARGDSTDAQGNSHPTNNLEYLYNPFTSTNYSFASNSATPVKANGWGISAEYQLGGGYRLMGNVYSDELSNVPADFVTFFNTPKTRFNIGLSNASITKNFGFNVIYKWQDKINWEGTFGSGTIPSFGTLDAQVNYRFTKQKVLIKLGGTNIINHYYRNAFGNPYIGGLYYVSLGYDIF